MSILVQYDALKFLVLSVKHENIEFNMKTEKAISVIVV